jgi:hypothetical protein
VCSGGECSRFGRNCFFHLHGERDIKLWCGNVGEDTKCRQTVVTKHLLIYVGLHAKWVMFISVCPAIYTYILTNV